MRTYNADVAAALARGLLDLQRTRIICLDEASSAMDNRTDEVVQRVLREDTRGATVICVAHRQCLHHPAIVADVFL